MKRTFIIAILLIFQCSPLQAEQLRLGTTFSPRQSEYLEMDWKETYHMILEIGFDIIRLGAYWNEIEKEEDIYDFSVLDWQVREARKKSIPVVLTIGMKAPRWPEYFIPEWVLEKVSLPFAADLSKKKYLRERTLKFIEKVVNHYKSEAIIRYWQVENEPMNRMGEKYWFIGKDFLKEEVALVRKLDEDSRPILLTVATYPNKFLSFLANISINHDPIKESLEICDILGLNIYPAIGYKFWWKDFYFWTKRAERQKYYSAVLALAKSKGKKVWGVELQAEPWEPGQLVHKGKERPPTGWPEMTEDIFREIHLLGVDTIFLWGAEYWRYRAMQYGDMKWWKTVFGILREKDQQ
jgi:hypothetical protein